MKAAPDQVALCSECGSALTPDRKCLPCLVRVAFDPAEDDAAAAHLFGDYEIARRGDGSLCELGRGAMGVTYRATDTVLHRSVALKVIEAPPAAKGHVVRDRFLREARAAAALQHPNVASVFQYGTTPAGDRCFYAMELVEGETLEALVRREGPMKVDTALEMATQVTAALVAAASHGLIHRDLKPGNIMLTAGGASAGELKVKVIDFGLAKAIASSGNEMDLTHGGFVGTPAFASPEQFTGAPADARSDIYSLGATLWYALTGEAPYEGWTIDEIRRSHSKLPLPVDRLAARNIPRCAIQLLRRILSMNPAERPASARELMDELEACRARLENAGSRKRSTVAAVAALLVAVTVAGYVALRPGSEPVSPAPPVKSVAVLPFVSLSEDQANSYFADGVQDEILTSLAKIADLKVTSRTSVMQFRNAENRSVQEIAQQLGVAHVLQGTVRRSGDRVRVTVQLIDARDDRHVWAESYEKTISDALTMQGELAKEIAGALHATLSPEEKATVERKLTDNAEAYVLYLKARQLEYNPDTGLEDYKAAVQLYEQAVELDPAFAVARARLASVAARIYHFYEPTEAWKQRAAAEIQESLRLQPNLGEGHFARGLFLYWLERDYGRAVQELRIAQTLMPNNTEVGTILGAIARREGRWEEAVATFRRMEATDPQNPNIVRNLVYVHGAVRNWAEAARAGERLHGLAPGSISVRIQVAYIHYFWKGSTAELETLLESVPPGVDPDGVVTAARWDVCMIKRDFAGAEAGLAAAAAAELSYLQGGPLPKSYFAGCAALARGDEARAQTLFEAARPSFEAAVQEAPQDAARHANLGLLYAFMGRKEAAIAEGRRAVELKPESRDAVDGPLMNGYLALIYTRVGERDLALGLIERLLHTAHSTDSAHYSVSLQDLRLRWEWDPLRNGPRFEKLIASAGATE